MAYSSKEDVQVFYELVKEGWEPTFNEIRDKFFPKHDKLRQKLLTGLLIKRVRRKLKGDDDLYFYCVDRDKDEEGNVVIKRKYKLLTASSEYTEVTNKLWKITDGFRKSCNQVISNGVEKYPNTLQPLFVEFKAGMKLLTNLAKGMTKQLESALSGEEDESSDK